MADTEFCSRCGLSLTEEGKCSGCGNAPEECSCTPEEIKASEEQAGE